MTLALFFALVSPVASAQQALFTPAQGFSGKSHGIGHLKLLLGKPRPFRVDSVGQQQADGVFRLDQTVTFDGKPAKHRSWLIRENGDLRYAAVLTDAGPVTGRTVGAQLDLRYRINGVLVMHQTLKLGPDGETIDNVGRITFLGIPIGSLHETITRTGD